jgi:transposase
MSKKEVDMSNTIPRNGLNVKQWKKIKPLLPPQKPKTGRPNKSHWVILHAILWVLRTGIPWRDLPSERFAPWQTVYSRFYRWSKQGIWQKILETLQQDADSKGEIDWNIHHVDSTVIRAHQHAAGARKISPDGKIRTNEDLALGRSHGGYTTKIHLKVDGKGKPLGWILTPGQFHDSPIFERLTQTGKIKRKGRGRPKHNPKAMAGDRGYSAKEHRRYLHARHVLDVIPTKKNEQSRSNFDAQLYKERNRVERTFNFFKQSRRLATRYDKLPEIFSAFLCIASIIMWL